MKKRNSSVRSKFLVSLSIVITVLTVVIATLSYNSSKKELESFAAKDMKIMTELVYQSLTNAMMSGMPEIVMGAETSAKNIKGFKRLHIEKSDKVIEVFGGSNDSATNNEIQEAFATKKTKLLNEYIDNNHIMRVVKPFIAEKRCLQCHYNAKAGDVLGVLELELSLDEMDSNVSHITFMIIIAVTVIALMIGGVVSYLLNVIVVKPFKELKESFGALLNQFKHNSSDLQFVFISKVGIVVKISC